MLRAVYDEITSNGLFPRGAAADNIIPETKPIQPTNSTLVKRFISLGTSTDKGKSVRGYYCPELCAMLPGSQITCGKYPRLLRGQGLPTRTTRAGS